MNYYAVVFLLCPPDLLRREPLFEGINVCNSQESGVRTRCAAIVNHYAIVNLLCRANLLRRSIFSTAGSFGQFGPWKYAKKKNETGQFWAICISFLYFRGQARGGQFCIFFVIFSYFWDSGFWGCVAGPQTQGEVLVVSCLVLQACVSFCGISDKSGPFLLLPCLYKNAVAHVGAQHADLFSRAIFKEIPYASWGPIFLELRGFYTELGLRPP